MFNCICGVRHHILFWWKLFSESRAAVEKKKDFQRWCSHNQLHGFICVPQLTLELIWGHKSSSDQWKVEKGRVALLGWQLKATVPLAPGSGYHEFQMTGLVSSGTGACGHYCFEWHFLLILHREVEQKKENTCKSQCYSVLHLENAKCKKLSIRYFYSTEIKCYLHMLKSFSLPVHKAYLQIKAAKAYDIIIFLSSFSFL